MRQHWHRRLSISYACEMSHYIFNVVSGEGAPEPVLREQATRSIRARLWAIDRDERHRDALTPGDLVLIYLGAPEWKFIGQAELASAVHAWTPAEGQVYPGDSPAGVLLAQVEEWDPPVPMSAVLSQTDRAEGARADFDAGVVRITVGLPTMQETKAGRGRASIGLR